MFSSRQRRIYRSSNTVTCIVVEIVIDIVVEIVVDIVVEIVGIIVNIVGVVVDIVGFVDDIVGIVGIIAYISLSKPSLISLPKSSALMSISSVSL